MYSSKSRAPENVSHFCTVHAIYITKCMPYTEFIYKIQVHKPKHWSDKEWEAFKSYKEERGES